jgi:hypothetical protein
LTFPAGHVPTADELNTVVPVVKVKTANETVNNTSTLQNDDHLAWPVVASGSYILDLYLYYQSNSTADFKFDWTYPTGTTFNWGATYYDVSSVLTNGGPFTQATTGAVGGTGAAVLAAVHYQITVGGTPGTFQMQFAQNVANASNTTVFAGSYGVMIRVQT